MTIALTFFAVLFVATILFALWIALLFLREKRKSVVPTIVPNDPIIESIATRYPFSYREVKRCFDAVQDYDKVEKMCEFSAQLGLGYIMGVE